MCRARYLDANKLVAFVLEALYDRSNQASLHAIRFYLHQQTPSVNGPQMPKNANQSSDHVSCRWQSRNIAWACRPVNDILSQGTACSEHCCCAL